MLNYVIGKEREEYAHGRGTERLLTGWKGAAGAGRNVRPGAAAGGNARPRALRYRCGRATRGGVINESGTAKKLRLSRRAAREASFISFFRIPYHLFKEAAP